MEGSHQKNTNWYRLQYVYKRGIAAADAAGHPRVLGIKEDAILDPRDARRVAADLTSELSAATRTTVGIFMERRGAPYFCPEVMPRR